jgi:hypothetical protein
MEVTIVIVALIGFIAFRQWMHHHSRILQHRERIAAIEKGVECPPLEKEVRTDTWNVQRLLLLSGGIWIAIGLGFFITFSIMLSYPQNEITKDLPQGFEYGGLIPIGIGVAHLITYYVGKKREKRC